MKTFFYTVLGFVLASPAWAQSASTATTTSHSGQAECPDGTVVNGICLPDQTGLPNQSVYDIVNNFMYWLLGIFGLLAIIAFVISGIQYLTAAGDEKRAETAKRNALYSIIGVLIAFSGLVIVYAVGNLLYASPQF